MRGKQKILVAMSGGVDSSVAAAVLLNQGYEVVGVTMKLWGGTSDTGCCSVSDVIAVSYTHLTLPTILLV